MPPYSPPEPLPRGKYLLALVCILCVLVALQACWHGVRDLRAQYLGSGLSR